jgi:hypothetical protein
MTLDGLLGGLFHLLGSDGAVFGTDGYGHPAGLAVGVGVLTGGVSRSPAMSYR